jgi:NADH:ubiquinone reductase (H+-translocating)
LRAGRRAADRERAGREKVERPFRYFDKGNMAVVDKNYAVLERHWLHSSDSLAWM